jgi:hypothetical protein
MASSGAVSAGAVAANAVSAGTASIGAAALATDVFALVDQMSAADSNAKATDRSGDIASFAALSEVAPPCATDGSFPFMFATY